ncbi:MAG: tetratricopeptide repeat protein, partial [Bacteroidaceae bacterium]|nr:tetratricopeptide repeat protein [Bacteroidaceae bacterium]
MKTARHLIPILWLFLAMPIWAQSDVGKQMSQYAQEYAKCSNTQRRLRLANDFFAFLRQIEYIDEPIAFPNGSHLDSVDVNVYYYVAEWYYGEGDYQSAIGYCTNATGCMGVVDDASKSDVYALLGAAYFRLGEFEKAAGALNKCYELDKNLGDFDRMSSTLNSIASVFVAAGKPQEAEKYIMEAIAANSFTSNLTRRAVLYGTASEIYRSMSDAEQSLTYAQKALDTERQLGDSARIGMRLSQLANAQLGLSKIDDARLSLEEAIPLLQRSGNLHSWGICQNQMGDIL